MIVVADTTPINYLAQLNLVDLLSALYTTLLLPTEVAAELRHPSTPAAVRLWAANFPSWVRVQAPKPSHVDLLQSLDAGERAAITLSIEVSATAVLMDERRARHIAEHVLHLNVTGTLGVLRDAHNLGLVDGPDALRRLCTETNYYQTRALQQRFLASLKP